MRDSVDATPHVPVRWWVRDAAQRKTVGQRADVCAPGPSATATNPAMVPVHVQQTSTTMRVRPRTGPVQQSGTSCQANTRCTCSVHTPTSAHVDAQSASAPVVHTTFPVCARAVTVPVCASASTHAASPRAVQLEKSAAHDLKLTRRHDQEQTLACVGAYSSILVCERQPRARTFHTCDRWSAWVWQAVVGGVGRERERGGGRSRGCGVSGSTAQVWRPTQRRRQVPGSANVRHQGRDAVLMPRHAVSRELACIFAALQWCVHVGLCASRLPGCVPTVATCVHVHVSAFAAPGPFPSSWHFVAGPRQQLARPIFCGELDVATSEHNTHTQRDAGVLSADRVRLLIAVHALSVCAHASFTHGTHVPAHAWWLYSGANRKAAVQKCWSRRTSVARMHAAKDHANQQWWAPDARDASPTAPAGLHHGLFVGCVGDGQEDGVLSANSARDCQHDGHGKRVCRMRHCPDNG